MSMEDQAQARYCQNIDKAGRKTFKYEAKEAMQIATDLTMSREARLVKLGEFIRECCVEF